MKPIWRRKGMLEFLIGCLIILVCLACEGFFPGTETAFVSLDRTRLKALSDKGDKKAGAIITLLEKPENFFSTTLLGTNFSTVISNTVATIMIITYLGENYASLAICIMAPLVLIFGEIVPKTVYRYHAETISVHIAGPLRIIAMILNPLVALLSQITEYFVRFFKLSTVVTKLMLGN